MLLYDKSFRTCKKDRNKGSSFKSAVETGLINMSFKVCGCGGIMCMKKDGLRRVVDGRFRCNRRLCRKTESLYTDAIFHYSKANVSTVLKIITSTI